MSMNWYLRLQINNFDFCQKDFIAEESMMILVDGEAEDELANRII